MDEFSNEFINEQVVSSDADDFDPFNIGVAAGTADAKSGSPVSPDSAEVVVDDNKSILSSSSALPPRIIVRFQIQEEVSSVSQISRENGASSDVQIEGTVLVSCVKESSGVFGL